MQGIDARVVKHGCAMQQSAGMKIAQPAMPGYALRKAGVALALALWASLPAAAGEFAFELDAPKFSITIPDIPPIAMQPHPMQGTHPHLRFLGADGAYSVSVITPSAAAGMGALECATAILRSLPARPNVPAADEIYRARLDDNTYIALYAVQLPGFLQLNAHFMSAAAGKHCIEVHASKIATTQDDIAPWFKGFGKAKIEIR